MSVTNTNTFIARLISQLYQDLDKNHLIQKWFERIITIEFLVARKIFQIKSYDKENIMNLCIRQNQYFKHIFDDNIEELEMNYPYHFYNQDIIKLLKENIKSSTPIEEIMNYQEDFKDYERFMHFKYTNRNSNVEIDKTNITMVTQIFTPKWIARYMVENIIPVNGAKYSLIEKIDKDIHFKTCKILDPCLGTGHLLLEIFEILMKKYQEDSNQDIKESIKQIYSKQLYGFDIDPSVINLSKFIFLMKAIELCPTYLDDDNLVVPNFVCIQTPNIKRSKLHEVNVLIETMKDASLIGSLIQVPDYDYASLLQLVTCQEEKEIVELAILLKMKYDIVITNPPYMGRKVLPSSILHYLNQNYQYAKSELYTAFIERCLDFLVPSGYLAMLTLHTWMFIKSFSSLRKYILTHFQIKSLLHLGKNTFENLNAYNALACAFIIKKEKTSEESLFIKLTEYETISEKEKGLKEQKNYYKISAKKFLNFNHYPFIYWLNDNEYHILIHQPKLGSFTHIRQGLATGDNKNYVRWWYEVEPSSIGFHCHSVESFLNSKKKYAPYNKGGDKTKWYATSKLVIQFDEKAYQALQKQGNHLPSKEYYFKKGITWSLFGFNSFNVRYKEEGYVFDVSGSSLFVDSSLEKYILGYLSSSVAFFYLSALAPTVNFQVGNIANLPIIIQKNKIHEINRLVESLINKAKWLDSQDELSWHYQANDFYNGYNCAVSFDEIIKNYKLQMDDLYRQIEKEEKQLNDIYNHIFKMNTSYVNTNQQNKHTIGHIIENLLSYLMGVVFDRYQIHNYVTPLDLKSFNEIETVIKEIKFLIIHKMGIDGMKQLERIFGHTIDEYFKNHYGKKHLLKYHQLPIYWYQIIDGRQMIGYYHSLLNIEKEKGIKYNYLKINAQYKIKTL